MATTISVRTAQTNEGALTASKHANHRENDPPMRRILAIEIEKYQRLMRDNPQNRETFWMEYIKRKEIFRSLTGLSSYDIYPSLDVNIHCKEALQKLFYSLKGNGWSKNQGWVGQAGSKIRQQIRVLEAEASQYEGIETPIVDRTRQSADEAPFAIVTAIDLSGQICLSIDCKIVFRTQIAYRILCI
jgi:hypothetical protein